MNEASQVIGVMGDTHGNIATMHQVADLMESVLGVSLIFHLGDDYRDAEQLEVAGHRVRMIAGLWCKEYATPRKRWLDDTVAGVRIAGCHAEKDLRAADRAADIVLTAHTHVAAVERLGSSIYVNPGHLRQAKDRGQAPSFATIVLGEDITVRIHELEGSVRREESFPRPRK